MARFAKINDDIRNGSTVLEFAWLDGTSDELDVRLLDEAMILKLATHGAKQKIVDAYNTKAESIPEARSMMGEVVEMLQRGEWSKRAEGAAGIIVQALARVKGWTIGEARARYNALDKASQRKVANAPEVLKAKADIMAERAKAAGEGADGEDDLDSILDM